MANTATMLHTIMAMVAIRFRSSRLRCSSRFRAAARRMASVFWLTGGRRAPVFWLTPGRCWGIRPVVCLTGGVTVPFLALATRSAVVLG